MSEFHSVVVIGAGLSGLYAAWRLQNEGKDVVLLEARERCGGRILSPVINADSNSENAACVDMGPAWVWPQLQPRLQQLITDMELQLFKQFTGGEMLYERNAQNIERYGGQSSHNHSYRIRGGSHVLTQALQNRLTKSLICLNTQVLTINRENLSISAIRNGQNCNYTADRIILALPLRIAGQAISFEPALEAETIELWNNTPTWMAGHCKMLFIYEKPFWREQKLSGEVFSQHGPLSEIYDGSPADESFYALTAFVGLSAQQRKLLKPEQLEGSCLAQLERLFGDESQNIKDIQVKDWSCDSFTTTELDLSGVARHPEYPDNAPRELWNGKLLIAGTESAREHGGYLEGALESVDEIMSILEYKN